MEYCIFLCPLLVLSPSPQSLHPFTPATYLSLRALLGLTFATSSENYKKKKKKNQPQDKTLL